jgi:signal peptidase I
MVKKFKLSQIKNIIFYTLTTFMLTILLVEVFLPKQTINILGFKTYTVVSGSMVPIYEIGDVIIVKKVDLVDLNEGDIITFYRDLNNDGKDEVVTHFLYSINTDINNIITYETIPNVSDEKDPWTLSEIDIIGVPSFSIPKIGWINIFVLILVRNPIFLGLIILNIAIIYFLIKYLKTKPKV